MPSHIEKNAFLDISEKKIDDNSFKFLDNPSYFNQSDIIQVVQEIIKLIADESFSLFKKLKSRRNKKFNKFKTACMNLHKFSRPQDENEYIQAKQDLKTLLNDFQTLHTEKKRTSKFKCSAQKSSDIFFILGKRGGRQISRIRDPLTGRTANNL